MKNFFEINRALRAKKKHLYIFVLCTLSLCTLVGCKKENEPETLVSNVSRPTWTVPTDYDSSSSMTAVVKVTNLNGQMVNEQIVNDSDLLAAFSGETCLGVASPQEGLFYLYIAAPITGNPSSVTLRYYSAHYKNLFEAKDAFPFQNDTNLGTVAAPFVPALVVVQ